MAVAHRIIIRLLDEYVAWPTVEEQREIARAWELEKVLRCANRTLFIQSYLKRLLCVNLFLFLDSAILFDVRFTLRVY